MLLLLTHCRCDGTCTAAAATAAVEDVQVVKNPLRHRGVQDMSRRRLHVARREDRPTKLLKIEVVAAHIGQLDRYFLRQGVFELDDVDAVFGETTASEGVERKGSSNLYASRRQEISTSDASRVRRDGTIAISSRPYPRRAVFPAPISMSATTTSLRRRLRRERYLA